MVSYFRFYLSHLQANFGVKMNNWLLDSLPMYYLFNLVAKIFKAMDYSVKGMANN